MCQLAIFLNCFFQLCLARENNSCLGDTNPDYGSLIPTLQALIVSSETRKFMTIKYRYQRLRTHTLLQTHMLEHVPVSLAGRTIGRTCIHQIKFQSPVHRFQTPLPLGSWRISQVHSSGTLQDDEHTFTNLTPMSFHTKS